MEQNDFGILVSLDGYIREKIPGVYVICHALWPQEDSIDPSHSIWEALFTQVPRKFLDKVLLPHFEDLAQKEDRHLVVSELSGPKGSVFQVRFIKNNGKPYKEPEYLKPNIFEYSYPKYISFLDEGEIRAIMDTHFCNSAGIPPRFPLTPEREKEIFGDVVDEENTEGESSESEEE